MSGWAKRIKSKNPENAEIDCTPASVEYWNWSSKKNLRIHVKWGATSGNGKINFLTIALLCNWMMDANLGKDSVYINPVIKP